MNRLLSKLKNDFEKKPVLLSCLLITAALLIFYSNSFTADWHYDDFHHIKENINIRKISNIPLFFKDPTTFSRNPNSRMYRPLLMSTHALNYQMALWFTRDGYNVVPYHITNFLFHLLSVLMIYFIVLYFFRFIIRIEGLEPSLPALFAALLFGLNTVNTETIVYISSRSSAMATMFALGSFYLYLKATHENRPRIGLLILSSLLYFCGLLSKEIAITLPALLFYFEYFRFLQNRGSNGWGEFFKRVKLLIPHATAAIAFLAIRSAIINDNLLKTVINKGGTGATRNLTAQLATQAKAWILYLREWLIPTGLSIDKAFPVSRNFAEGKVLVSVLIIFLILALGWMLRKKHPVVLFGVLWWFTALVPTSIFRLNVPVNDHRMYLPGFGFTIIFVYIVARLYVRFRQDGGWYLKVFVTTCLAVLLFMGLGTFKRNMAFATEESMWKDVILKDKNSVRGYNNLGIYYEQHHEWDKALTYYQQTIRLAPMFPNPYINIGNVYHKKKEYDKAEQWMKRALQLDPRSALASYNLGNILREAGKTQEALAAYNRALQLNPRYIEAANNMANIYFKLQKYPEAIQYYQRALFIDPTFAMSYYNIALANERLGRWNDAVTNYEQFMKFWLGDPKYLKIAKQKISAIKNRPQQ